MLTKSFPTLALPSSGDGSAKLITLSAYLKLPDLLALYNYSSQQLKSFLQLSSNKMIITMVKIQSSKGQLDTKKRQGLKIIDCEKALYR